MNNPIIDQLCRYRKGEFISTKEMNGLVLSYIRTSNDTLFLVNLIAMLKLESGTLGEIVMECIRNSTDTNLGRINDYIVTKGVYRKTYLDCIFAIINNERARKRFESLYNNNEKIYPYCCVIGSLKLLEIKFNFTVEYCDCGSIWCPKCVAILLLLHRVSFHSFNNMDIKVREILEFNYYFANDSFLSGTPIKSLLEYVGIDRLLRYILDEEYVLEQLKDTIDVTKYRGKFCDQSIFID